MEKLIRQLMRTHLYADYVCTSGIFKLEYSTEGGPAPHSVLDQYLRNGGDKRLINPQQQDRHLELRMFYHYAEWLATIR